MRAELDPNQISSTHAPTRGTMLVASGADDVEQLGCTIYYPQRLRRLRQSPACKLLVRTTALESVSLGNATYTSDVEIDCSELRTSYHVNVPLSGTIDSEIGNTIAQATPRSATIYQPTGRTRIRCWHGSTRALTLKIDRTALEDCLHALLGRPWSGPIDFAASLDIEHGPGASWWALVRQLDQQLQSADEANSLARFPVMAKHLEQGVMVGLLLAADHRSRSELQGPTHPLRPRTVKSVIEVIEATPEGPLTAIELAKIAGCSVRRLQESFHDCVGMTPMAYLRETRLTRVRDALVEADPATTSVSEIAHTWGFSNLGRFSIAYKRKFGVSPSVALRS